MALPWAAATSIATSTRLSAATIPSVRQAGFYWLGHFRSDGLIRDLAGNLYGTTMGGGNLNCDVNEIVGCDYTLGPAGRILLVRSFQIGRFDPGPGGKPLWHYHGRRQPQLRRQRDCRLRLYPRSGRQDSTG